MDDGREAQLSDARIPGVNRIARNLLEISVEDIRKEVKMIENGKAPVMNGVTSKMLKYGGESLVEWLTRVCNVCFMEVRVLKEWQKTVIVPLISRLVTQDNPICCEIGHG